ncbi:MAG: DUF937 domain-containing protein [Gemmatimonadaceae bacterium]|nr:DUF937 domain-containing protein [Gemmatimonadaceae bacterium]
MSIIGLVRQQLGSTGVQQIGDRLGVDPATVEQALNAALPAIVGGMAGTAAAPGGESAIESALGDTVTSGPLGGLGDILGGLAAGGGAGGILGSILGRHNDDVHDGVQQASGLDSEKTKQLLLILAPIVMSVLARRRAASANNAPDGKGMGDVLADEARGAQKRADSPHIGGLLGKILDAVQ